MSYGKNLLRSLYLFRQGGAPFRVLRTDPGATLQFTRPLSQFALNLHRRKMPGPLVWIDCEMTGLNPRTDHIIEISCFVTDGQLNLLEPHGYTNVVHCPKSRLDEMDEWCTTTHTKTGLVDRVLQSKNTKEQVEEELLAYIGRFTKPKLGVLAGNTVHMDRVFMMSDFPRIVDFLHYRIVDVSSIKEIGYRQNPKLMQLVPPKKMTHTARQDILESIAELKWYYENYFRPPSELASANDVSSR